MIIRTAIVFAMFFLSSCSSLLHKLYKIQSDERMYKMEDYNFLNEKALTQWWYFDFFFDDGSVLVLMFVPNHWWSDPEKVADPETLIYASYMKANGEVVRAKKIIESKEVQYYENGLKCAYLEILKSHNKSTREYTINFMLDEIKGSVQIVSGSKAFSPLPWGSIGTFGTNHILKKKGKGLAYRYAAHVPKGEVSCNLDVGGDHFDLLGKAYHEQGWFNGQPHQMGDGWIWFHFASENVNLFGAKSFFYLEMNGEQIIGGLNSYDRRCLVSDRVLADDPPNLLVGGKLSFTSSRTSFDVASIGQTSTPLISIPSTETDQLWGTVLQPSRIHIYHNGEELLEEGNLLLETCRMLR